MKTTDVERYGENYADLSMNAALRAERIACQLRNLVYQTAPKERETYMKKAANAQGIDIRQEANYTAISLPGLLPKRKQHINSAFLYEPLNYALQDYLASHSLPLYQECVVCFSQVYDRNGPFQRVRDYDNLEFKQLLDTIASYIMVDDSGLFCDSYHTTEMGERDYTVIYIMGKSYSPSGFRKEKRDRNHIGNFLISDEENTIWVKITYIAGKTCFFYSPKGPFLPKYRLIWVKNGGGRLICFILTLQNTGCWK